MLNRGGGGSSSIATTNHAKKLTLPVTTTNMDVDCQDIKYLKRRSVRNSPGHVVGLMLLFILILGLWHYSIPALHHQQAELARRTRLRADLLFAAQGRRLEETFLLERNSADRTQRQATLSQWLEQLDQEIRNNINGGIRWIRPYLLPPLGEVQDRSSGDGNVKNHRGVDHPNRERFLKVYRKGTVMKWETEWGNMLRSGIPIRGPLVDYTDHRKYTYPEVIPDVPSADVYPPLQPLGELMSRWNHDDDNTGIIHESLQHFNFSNPKELAMAVKYRQAEVPFKLYDVPEIDAATVKWTDDYVEAGFRSPEVSGHAQESPNNYFAFFIPKSWVVNTLGLVPVRLNDWTYKTWAEHARYADAVSLPPDMPHFYWQSGVPKEQHLQDESHWGFISRDLPSFSARTDNFFLFHADSQKGIQCRMGERGVVAATHYDSGMNMIAMIRGAKRYILQPPRECSKLGLFAAPHSPLYRHSILNYAHMRYLNDPTVGMSDEERAWLHKAATAQTVETVLKQGEVLYIPSHWFHYIVSLQKSAQCNVRSGINYEGHPFFGNRQTVEECRDYDDTTTATS